MTVLITGGSGVVGLHTARAMAESGEDVVAYSIPAAPPAPGLVLGNLAPRVRFVEGDVRDFDRMRDTVERYNVVGIIHAAALTGEAQARARPHETFTVNVGGTGNVLEVARLAKMRRVVLIGSSSEYGRREDLRPIGEEEVNVDGLYSETKFLGYRLGQRYGALFGLDVLTARLNSVYGPNTRFNPLRGLVGNTLIAHLCRAVARNESVALEGGGDYPRGWTYAADAARGLCLAYLAEAPRHRVYNIASGRLYTVAEVVDSIRRVEPRASISVGPGCWEDDPFQAGSLRGPLDISRARDDLGYAPVYELDEGIRAYIDWWRRLETD